MKVIDLLNKIANKEELPYRIEVDGEGYEFDLIGFFYRNIKTEKDLLEDGKKYMTSEFLKFDVTEIYQKEQDKIDIQKMQELTYKGKRIELGTTEKITDDIDDYCPAINECLDMCGIEINKLIRAVKQLDTEIKEINNAR